MRFLGPMLLLLAMEAWESSSFCARRVIHRPVRGLKSVIDDKKAASFGNEGPFAFMGPVLDTMGLVEGKRVVYGTLSMDVNDSERLSQEESLELRAKAAKESTNIDDAERHRRDSVGTIVLAIAAAYASWAALQIGFTGHVLRFLTAFPLFLGVGYKVSAKEGL